MVEGGRYVCECVCACVYKCNRMKIFARHISHSDNQQKPPRFMQTAKWKIIHTYTHFMDANVRFYLNIFLSLSFHISLKYSQNLFLFLSLLSLISPFSYIAKPPSCAADNTKIN